MLLQSVLRGGLTLLAVVAVSLVGAWYRRRSKPRRGAARMPVLIAVIGWLFVAVGLMMALVAFTTGDPDGADDTLAMRIASIAIVVGGIAFLLMRRNFWLDVGPYEVRFRTILGRERHIRYDQIETYSESFVSGQPFVRIRSVDGTSLSVNPRIYDISWIERAIEFHRGYGVWPTPGTYRAYGAD